MKRKIGVFYFSGTGNTQNIVFNLKEYLEVLKNSVVIYKIEDILKKKITIEYSEFDKFVLSYPIYSMNPPQIIYKFIKKLPENLSKELIIISTAGDFSELNSGYISNLNKLLQRKSINLIYHSILAMPSNFFIKYPDELSKSLYNASLRKVEVIAKEISSDKINLKKISLFQRFISFIGKMEHFGAIIFGKTLRINNKCIFCLKCARNCPSDNIYFKKKKLKTGLNCLFCMRCVYSCPENAIYNPFVNFVILKDGYNINKFINSNYNEFDFNSTKSNYFKHFKEYIESNKNY